MLEEDTLNLIKEKFNIDLNGKLPIVINMRRHRELLSLFDELGFKKGVEIGVRKGLYSKWICHMIKGVTLFCVDPWKPYDTYVESVYEDQEFMNKSFLETQERLKDYNCRFIRKTSAEAVDDFLDNSLDFVFIDGNHSFEYVIEDIAKWSRKVRPGGIISGHDYWRSIDRKDPTYDVLSQTERIRLCQVKDAVDAWTFSNDIKPWFITKGDKCPSWFWVKK